MKSALFHPSLISSGRWPPLFASNSKAKLQALLRAADVRLDGRRPWDIQVHQPKFFSRVFAEGSLGVGDSYAEGWWDCERLDEMVCRAARARVDQKLFSWSLVWEVAKAKLLNLQRRASVFANASRHYDIGDDLYRGMLGSTMVYSCAYWRGAKDLDTAQRNKMELCCRKLDLKPGMKVLDIGCGWGAFAAYMARRHRVEVVGITAAEHQYQVAKKLAEKLPVQIRRQDYRDLPKEKFDRIVSLGMFEHVGHRNHGNFMEVAATRLKDDGLFLLHTIGGNRSESNIDPWISRRIFPNAVIPSIRQIGEAAEGRFVMEDWHNFGPDYDKTLMAWHQNFVKHWPHLKRRYSEKFFRMWNFYLLACAGVFRARELQLWQVLFSKGKNRGHRVQ